MNISVCPSCGSEAIVCKRGSLVRRYRDERYETPEVTYFECPDCGERVYDRDAAREGLARSPAFRRGSAGR